MYITVSGKRAQCGPHTANCDVTYACTPRQEHVILELLLELVGSLKIITKGIHNA